MQSKRLAALMPVLLLLSSLAQSGEAPVEPESTSVVEMGIEEIAVTGQRPRDLRRLMMDYIGAIGDPVSRGHGFARWRDKVCVGVYNVGNREAAEYIADRISLVALEIGLQPGEPGCRPNIYIVLSPDGRELATRMSEISPAMFRPFGGAGGTTQGLAALARFTRSEAPVRWWQITMIVDEFGMPLIDIWSGDALPVVRGSNSRLRRTITDELWGCLVIVDAGKVSGKTWTQLADYLAMVALAQIDPLNLPAAHDSILNLFGTGNPQSISEMDISYLQALYKIDTTMMPQTHRGLIATQMMRNAK